MLRVLQVIGSMNRGGAETLIMNIYRQLDRNKVQFDFIVHTDKKCDFDDEIEFLGGKIYRVPRFKGNNLISYFNIWKHFFLKHPEYKIIHGHIGSSAAIYLTVAKRYGLYTIIHSHSAGFERNLKGYMFYFYSYPTRFIADYFFGCSIKAAEKRFGKRVISDNDKFSVLKNAIDVESFVFSSERREKIRNDLGIKDQTIYGHVGRITYAKNHLFLLDIFEHIKREEKDAILLLVGDGELREEIEVKVKSKSLTDSVIFTGMVGNVNDYLQAMDVFIFPSFYEGLPTTVIEAQASGLPCYISDTITSEVAISPLVKQLSIEIKPQKWAEVIINSRFNMRSNNTELIQSAGYSIRTTAKWLETFYEKKGARCIL